MAEYLDALGPLLRGEDVNVHGERVSAVALSPVGPKQTRTPGLLVAALGPRMLELAGSLSDGTVLWMTGQKTIASHIAPLLRDAAAKAGRPAPRIVCSLPVIVTNDATRARERVNEELAVYATLPSYAAMLEREDASDPAGVSLLGSKQQVLEGLDALREAGVTEFSGAVSGSSEEREAALEVLLEYGKLS
jgi:F420-dependent oxidoreductase-like protein